MRGKQAREPNKKSEQEKQARERDKQERQAREPDKRKRGKQERKDKSGAREKRQKTRKKKKRGRGEGRRAGKKNLRVDGALLLEGHELVEVILTLCPPKVLVHLLLAQQVGQSLLVDGAHLLGICTAVPRTRLSKKEKKTNRQTGKRE